MAFPFFQRENLAELARQFDLNSYNPSIELQGLVTGVDNVRYDVWLSPQFIDVTRQHLARLVAKAGTVEDILARTGETTQRVNAFKGSKPTPADPNEFKRRIADLQVASLNRAKAEGNTSLDFLARIAILKFLRSELADQYNATLERLRARLKAFEGPRQMNMQMGVNLRERTAGFQLAKKTILRKAGEELFHTLREVEKETLTRMRRSLFGVSETPGYDLFVNPLIFTENGRDDYLNAEHYVMLGNFDRDPDRYLRMLDFARDYMKVLEVGSSDEELDALLAAPENAQELMANGVPDENTAAGRAQKVLLDNWGQTLDREGVLDHIIAAYETVPLLVEYAPTINAQQLKNALISTVERKRVESLLAEQSRISASNFQAAAKRVSSYRIPEKARIAGRFLRDFMRYHRDLRRLDVLSSALDMVSVITSDKLRNLSDINRTLYEFLLPEEQRPAEDRVNHHIILKADIRDSTTLTRTLSERGLNPASYFSLNFYDPVNKLLPKYQASKVFIEGDAVILALFEHEGEVGVGVAKTCVLAREMVSIVRAYNEQSEKAGLPTLELGIGVCYQDSPPMYLMDGDHRIMISKALNESDRLASCNKGARKVFAQPGSLFNVVSVQTIEDADTGGNPDEFLMRYNVGGIHISAEAFDKMRREISLELFEVELPTFWGREKVRLYSGIVPVAPDVFHRIVVRESKTPRVDAKNFAIKRWTDRLYYEVCTNDRIYDMVETYLKTRKVDHTHAPAELSKSTSAARS
jgi:class 3 adenylate cyclase